MITSKLTGVEYEPSNNTILWLTNCQQIATYLYYDEHLFDDLIDIIATKKNNKVELTYVFRKTPRLRELYKKWNEYSFKDI
jgi:hypothetical protein